MTAKIPGNIPRLTGHRILVIEDEYFIADEISGTVRELGAEVVGPIGEASEALDVARVEARIDAAILDINLRGDMVFPIADTLRSRGIPFIFATGYDCTTIPAEYSTVPCCEKPFDVELLARKLTGLLVRP